jgi:FkbM family methyltransferase
MTEVEHKAWMRVYLAVARAYLLFARILRRLFPKRVMQVHFRGRTYKVFGNFDLKLLLAFESRMEPGTYAIFDRFLQSDSVCIDLGAYAGATVLYCSHIAGKVYAIEADPVAFAMLSKNVSLNPELNRKIVLVNKCISNQRGSAEIGSLLFGGDGMSSMSYSTPRTAWSVDTITFEELLRDYSIAKCDFVKMDIEGAEALVLPTMSDFLSVRKPDLHLSMHPQFFREPERDKKAVIEILRTYKNAFTTRGEKIDIQKYILEMGDRFYEVFLTEKDWA